MTETLRDIFASFALMGLLAGYRNETDRKLEVDTITGMAYVIADSMLEQKKKTDVNS